MAQQRVDKENSLMTARTLLTVGQYLMVGFALVHHDSARAFLFSHTSLGFPLFLPF